MINLNDGAGALYMGDVGCCMLWGNKLFCEDLWLGISSHIRREEFSDECDMFVFKIMINAKLWINVDKKTKKQ